VAGGPSGVTGAVAADVPTRPAAFVADTVTVYAVPLGRSGMRQAVSSEAVQLAPPGFAVATYCVIGDPPVSSGAVQVTSIAASPAVTATSAGAPGAPTGTTEGDGWLAPDLSPAAFAAVTANV
jgi:hypothetical protein